MFTPYPPWRSTYSAPSASNTLEPRPWLTKIGWGQAICQLDVTPPASEPFAFSSRAAEAGWRATNSFSPAAISSSIRSKSALVHAVAVVAMLHLAF
jgi:hypothetical protein